MKFTFEVTSTHCQAKNWIVAGLRRNLTGESKSDILKACQETAKELKMKVKFVAGKYVFSDKKGMRQ